MRKWRTWKSRWIIAFSLLRPANSRRYSTIVHPAPSLRSADIRQVVLYFDLWMQPAFVSFFAISLCWTLLTACGEASRLTDQNSIRPSPTSLCLSSSFLVYAVHSSSPYCANMRRLHFGLEIQRTTSNRSLPLCIDLLSSFDLLLHAS